MDSFCIYLKEITSKLANELSMLLYTKSLPTCRHAKKWTHCCLERKMDCNETRAEATVCQLSQVPHIYWREILISAENSLQSGPEPIAQTGALLPLMALMGHEASGRQRIITRVSGDSSSIIPEIRSERRRMMSFLNTLDRK
jgi:hypothetical protein